MFVDGVVCVQLFVSSVVCVFCALNLQVEMLALESVMDSAEPVVSTLGCQVNSQMDYES